MRISSLVAFLAITTASRSALSAAGFDPDRGKVVTVGAAFAEPFDDAAPTGLVLFDASYRPLTADQIKSAIVQDEAQAIEGKAALELGGTIVDGFLDLRPLAARLSGRRVEARFWQLARGTVARASLMWVSGSPDPLLRADDFNRTFILTQAAFQPTGRATDDGWQEWTTGPFDFSAGGQLPATLLNFYDASVNDANAGIGALDSSVRVRLDAFTIDDLGPALVPNVACTLLNEASGCGSDGLCMYGRCTDGALAYGTKLENPALRSQYIDRRIFEFQTFEGGRVPLTKMQTFASNLRALESGTVSAAHYWTVFSGAVQDLEDGHASAPIATYRSQISSGVCLNIGQTDLLPSPDQRPIVFSLPTTNPIARSLQKGDALMKIDGAQLADWVQAARRYLEYHGDPAARTVVTAPMIIDAAIRTGATLELARCTQMTACTQGQLTTVQVDLGALESGIWTGSPPDWRNDYDVCDYRFHRAIDTPAGKTYAFAGFTDDAGVRWVQFNGVPSQYQQGGQEWFTTMNSAFSSQPAKILLDERLGDGGSIETVDLLASYLLGASEVYSAEMIPQLGIPVGDAIRSALRACNETPNRSSDCGGFYEWRVGSFETTQGTDESSKLAVLLGQDVSGNDFLTKFITYRSAAVTRIFGGAPTFGAFGVIWILPSIGGELIGGSLQVHDSIFRANSADPISTFATSTGIPPDQIIVQKQSDAVRDVDTVVEAAKAWLAQ